MFHRRIAGKAPRKSPHLVLDSSLPRRRGHHERMSMTIQTAKPGSVRRSARLPCCSAIVAAGLCRARRCRPAAACDRMAETAADQGRSGGARRPQTRDAAFTRVATREIEAALAANDAELAKSFRRAGARPAGVQSPRNSPKRSKPPSKAANSAVAAGEFHARPHHRRAGRLVSLAGTALGDLFVFGDIRDAVREGSRLARARRPTELILGLAVRRHRGHRRDLCVARRRRAGARRPVGGEGRAQDRAPRRAHGDWVDAFAARRGRLVRACARRWRARRSTEPAVAVRAAREAVKVEKADDLLRLARDVGRVQTKAGTQAALDGLKIADTPARNGARREACRREGRQDARDPQGARPRRDRADARHIRSRAVDVLGAC